MKIPPELVDSMLAMFMAALTRGWIDVRSLEPLLKTIVERGYAKEAREMLAEILVMLDNMERGQQP